MKILLATYWGVPNEGDAHTYIDILKNGLEAEGHQVDLLSHDQWWQNVYVNCDKENSIQVTKIRDPLSREILVYYDVHYKEVDNWLVWQDIHRHTFELAAAYLVDITQYDIIHTMDIFSTRAFSRIKPPDIPLLATIHGLNIENALKRGEIFGRDSVRWKYYSTLETYGAKSADLTIVPQWLKEEYVEKYNVPEDRLITSPYSLDQDAVNKALEIYKFIYQK